MKEPLSLPHDWFPRCVPENVEIGEGSWLYSAFAFVHYRSQRPVGVRVGRHSGLYNGTFFDLGPEGEVQIGDYCTLVGAIIASNQRVVIHDYVFIAHEVVIADGPVAVPGGEPGRSGVTIEENAWIGAQAVLLAGARVGKNAIVGAAAVISGDVPANAIAAGNPAMIVGYSKH